MATNNTADKIRLAVYTSVFGALWGLLEMTAGSYLHMIHFPFRGAAMAGIGAVILCIERSYTPVRGATFYTGIVALALKFLSIGAFKLGPAMGIMIETVIAEAVLSLFGFRTFSILLTAFLCTLEGIPHFFVTNWLFYGKDIFAAYLEVVKQMQSFFGLNPAFWKQILAAWIAGHLVIGAACGALTLNAARYLRKL